MSCSNTLCRVKVTARLVPHFQDVEIEVSGQNCDDISNVLHKVLDNIRTEKLLIHPLIKMPVLLAKKILAKRFRGFSRGR